LFESLGMLAWAYDVEFMFLKDLATHLKNDRIKKILLEIDITTRTISSECIKDSVNKFHGG